MDHGLTVARVFMGDSLGFHIIFVMFGLVLPVMVVLLEVFSLWRRNEQLMSIAKLWAKIMTLLVVAGVISGTVVAVQMALVWPGILKFGGKVIGLPFMFETYAFIVEAVFLALYMATWGNKRVKRWIHVLFGVGVVIGSTLSAFAITSVNAWMNFPTGFTIVEGKFKDIDVWQAMFSQASIIEFLHSVSGYYLAIALAMAGMYAIKLFRNRRHAAKVPKLSIDAKVVHFLMIFAFVALVSVVVTADLTGKYLAQNEPTKLAALELVDKTSSNVPLIYGGVLGDDGRIVGPYIKIPGALSLLATNSFDGTVKGLNEVPTDQRPPAVVHVLFDIKLALVGIIVAIIFLYFAMWLWRRQWLSSRVWLMIFGIISFSGILVVELGWAMAEMARQPWAVNGYVTTEQAVTKLSDVTSFAYMFPVAFILLFAVTIFGVRKIVRNHKVAGI